MKNEPAKQQRPNYSNLFEMLNRQYHRLDPHHDTWELWIKSSKTAEEIFEVAIGTILVQNTNWRNVDRAIENLYQANIHSFEDLTSLKSEKIEYLIKPAGFYKQKASYLQALSRLLLSFSDLMLPPTRDTLLNCPGIGKETADSILLYCFQQPISVVGTYTRRFLARYHLKEVYLKLNYEKIQAEIQQELPRDSLVLGRFHALIVVHCQNTCQKHDPKCDVCTLRSVCQYGMLFEEDPSRVRLQEKISHIKNRSVAKSPI
ncbi:MAG: endonuclease III domain-containing protein [Candidatus Heimdallarchaeota archaeon]